MKTLIILLFLWPAACMSQTDTIPAVMLVSDTTKIDTNYYSVQFENGLYSQKKSNDYVITIHGFIAFDDAANTITYLNWEKEALDPKFVVVNAILKPKKP